MDKPCNTSKNALERKSCSGDGSVGNGVCHGTLHPSEPSMAHSLKPVNGVACQDGLWATRSEAYSPLRDRWRDKGAEEGKAQEGAHSALTLDELLDMELQKMSTESLLTSACHNFPSSSSPVPNGVLETGESERGIPLGVLEGETVDSVGATSQNLEPPICQQKEDGFDATGVEGDGDPGKKEEKTQFTAYDGWEEMERERDEEDESRNRGSEGDRDSRMQGMSRRLRGGKRGKGRGSGSAGDPPVAGEPTQPPTAPSSSKVSTSSGSRHKQARRRNHHHHHQTRPMGHTALRMAQGYFALLSESLCPWCLSCVLVVVELIVTVTHRCGEVVEAGGAAVYDSGYRLLRKASGLPATKAEARFLLAQMRGRGKALAAWVMKMATSCLGLALAFARVVRLLGRGRRWWATFRIAAVLGSVVCVWERVKRTLIWRSEPQETSAPKSPDSMGRFYPEQELDRLLALTQIPEDDLDPFSVLGVDTSATDPELKRAYRQLAVLVHPDKNKHPRAGEAFKVLRAAWDIVSNPETRRTYELKRMAETELSKSMSEFLTKLQDDLKEAMNTMMCTKCEGKHRRFEIERDPTEARFCAECKKYHGAEEGDFWAESSMLGLRITYFAFIDGKVYDITEWAGCQRIGISPDTHRVPYHISFGSKNNGSAPRHRTPSEPPPVPASPADLQDFFSRIFQGGPANGMAGGEGFFPTASPPHQPPGSSAAAGSSFTAAPSPGCWGAGARTEGAKPPRRRKKVRRSFPR
ncbi:hypothetical protein AAFF_G00102820 [Aldrovandia affinis]|uniref:J domain-containing protein n=1 Tax=Aldrovandia affinis TaxID=143900 RepID=A0AAD7RUJ6_9TELE|nr:hypothetical protein AAFF_G00102820 [Aldrovandia affinis]